MHVCNDRDTNKVIGKPAQTQMTTLTVIINQSCTYQKDEGSFRADEICIASRYCRTGFMFYSCHIIN